MNELNFSTFAEAYEYLLGTCFYSPDIESAPRGLKVRELLNCQFSISNPELCLFENHVRSSKKSYIKREISWYDTRSNDPSYIEKYAPIWGQIKNPDGTINSNYGRLVYYPYNTNGDNQWNWAKLALIFDQDTRQAVMHFNRTEHQFSGVKDFPCTMYGIFRIVNNKLNFTIRMRSNDLIFGLPNDIAYFVTLQMRMVSELQDFYPGLTIGTYTHSADSLHIYEPHWKEVSDMLNFEFKPLHLESIYD